MQGRNFLAIVCFIIRLAPPVVAENYGLASNQTEEETSVLVKELLQNMDTNVRPHAGGPPVDVSIDFHVTSMGPIDERNMDITVNIFVRQKWHDGRLTYQKPFRFLTLNSASVSQVWTPDIFFPFEKKATFHDVTVPNRLLKIYPSGDIMYSARVTLVNSCPMDLSHFPLDRQICQIKIESYSYEESEMRLVWDNDIPVELDPELELPQMKLIGNPETTKCLRTYKTGSYPCLVVTFHLQREYGFFILQTYFPSVLIVVLSWVSFWINIDAVPARVSLGVTTVLTMTTQLSGSKSSIPQATYLKAIDVWMAMCMLFVFAALLEFAFVNAMSKDIETHEEGTPKGQTTEQKETIDPSSNIRISHKCRRCSRRQAAHLTDNVSRVVFPTLFLIFNLAYWSFYLYAPNPDSN